MDQKVSEILGKTKDIIFKFWITSNEWYDKLSSGWHFIIPLVGGLLCAFLQFALGLLLFIALVVWRFMYLIENRQKN